MADHKFQLADGSYPIDRCTGHNSVASAAKLAHHSKNHSFEEVKAHVMKAKKALGCSDDVLPDTEEWGRGGGGESKGRLLEGVERRYIPIATAGLQIERRSGAPTRVSGHAAVFNQTADVGFWREIIRPGAFKRTIRENRNDIAALIDHEPSRVLGRLSNGRLELREDAQGLFMEVRPTDTSYSRDLLTNIAEGNVTKQSFGFSVGRGGSIWTEVDGEEQRELIDVELYDVSPVTYPAYQGTDVQVRQLCRQADLDFEGLAKAVVRRQRGLELSHADLDILTRAFNRLPAPIGLEGQAPPTPTAVLQSSPQAWRLALRRRQWALTLKSARQMTADGDADEDPGSLAQAIDQVLDEACEAHAAGDDDQGWQLVTAASATVDRLLEVLKVPDSDETEPPD